MDHYDQLESRTQAQREKDLFAALPKQIQYIQQNTRNRALEAVDYRSIDSRRALADLPVTRKSQLMSLQQESPPFGGLVAPPITDVAKVFISPGPIFEPEGKQSNYWRYARALYAAGFRKGDLVHNTFSYHFTPAGAMVETGAHALGCAVIPAGVGQTEIQVQALERLRPRGYVGTPSFLKIILEKAQEVGADITALKKASVAAEALPPSLRAEIEAYGVEVVQVYATADLGMIAYESSAQEGMILDEELILEIVKPGTGDPVQEGDVGEVLITNFNRAYPLVRLATGDLSAVLPGISSCGRTNHRIKGWLGRADQSTKVRGMFVHPSQIAAIERSYPTVLKSRLVVDREGGKDVMVLQCEQDVGDDEGLREAMVTSLREITSLRGDVKFVEPGSLANDGKVIDDIRSMD
ncbi:phenylacetate--CoA ligase family protein [Pseudomonadota bacterium]